MNLKVIILINLIFISFIKADVQCLGLINNAKFYSGEGVCVWKYASSFITPRQIFKLSNGDILLEQDSSVTLLSDVNQDGYISDTEKFILASVSGLTHSVTMNGNYIYASTQTGIYRWPYTVGSKAKIQTAEQLVISSIPTGGHITRTIIFDSQNKLYFSLGSQGNIDDNSNHARVFFCDVDLDNIPGGGYDYSLCQTHANGTRNEVGLRFDPSGVLWGVENGIDQLVRSDMTPSDIHMDNPCEEVNKFTVKGGFYGYPYCFSEGVLIDTYAKGPGSQWAVNNFLMNATSGITDEYCTTNAIKPAYCMPAHAAPLDLLFYNSTTLPTQFKTGLFVTQHGSWNRKPASGYQVVHFDIEFDSEMNSYSVVPNSMKKVVGAANVGDQWTARPVSLVHLSPCGPVEECFLFSSDKDGSIYAFSGFVDGTIVPSGSPTTTSKMASNLNQLFVNYQIIILLSLLLLII